MDDALFLRRHLAPERRFLGSKLKNTTASSIDFAIATSLPAGFSATLNQADGSVESYQSSFQTEIPYLVNNVECLFKSYNTKNTCKGDCAATLDGIGFQATCSQSTVPFNLPLDNASDATGNGTDIFSADFSWNAAAPTTIGMNTLFKSTGNLTGKFIVNNCTLKLASVKYPVDVQFNATGEWEPNWYWSLASQQLTPSHASSTYMPSEVNSLLAEVPETNVTAYSGVVEALKSYYDSRIYLHPTANGTTLRIVGQFAQQLQPSSMGYNDDGTPISLPNKCNNSFTYFGWNPVYNDPTSYLLDSVRKTLFYTSIFAADQDTTTIQTVHHSNDIITRNEYAVVW